jgi:hypothetical protein
VAILLTTQKGDVLNAREAAGDGPIMLIPKPFTVKQLVGSVHMALNGTLQEA